MSVELHHGDCVDILPSIPPQSVDAVITDPPYPEIKRAYGKLTVDEWWDLMMVVCKETRRILKPTGSAVFILQPNSKHVGQMRGWLWEFMAWVCRDWNMVQDAYWWNTTSQPVYHTRREIGLMRQSIKICVWAGKQNCFRDQSRILWDEAQSTAMKRAAGRIGRIGRQNNPSGHSMDERKCFAVSLEREGVTPYNILPIPNAKNNTSAGAHGHGAGTPLKLADWWVRYICPPGGTVADWFLGSGTMGLAAIENGCDFVGIEKFPEDREINDKDNPDYFGLSKRRIEHARSRIVQGEMELA